MSVDEKNYIKPMPFLKNDVVDNYIELTTQMKNYEIYTIKGQLLDKGNSQILIDIARFSEGVYFIVCETSLGNQVVQKFMISRE
jgi:hypothetical protein